MLPPHWKLGEPMSNERIKKAMNLMFATILQRWGGMEDDLQAFYFPALASIVWHSIFLKEMVAACPGHPLNMIPLLSNQELLQDLKELITLKLKGQVKSATGIPPHVQHASVAKKILFLYVETLKMVQEMVEKSKTL